MSFNSKYFRHRRFSRQRHGQDMTSFFAKQATDLSATATAKAITPVRTTNTKAEGLLTITDIDAGDSLRISGRAYNFVTALTEVKATGTLTFGANAQNGDTVQVGDLTYTYKTALTEVKAARTFTGSANPSNAQTLVIGTKTYTFESSLTNVDGHIKIGADLAATLTNLKNAVNASGGTPGTDYAAANTVHPTVTASGTSPSFIATAKTAGTAGNSIACTGTAGGGAWAGATLTGGVDAIAFEVKIGVDASTSLDNLIAAINAGSGSGSTYSTGTTASPHVAAAAGSGDTMVLTALSGGTAPNSVATVSEVSSSSFADDTLGGGVDSTSLEVVVGNGTTEARDNLIRAITNGAGEGENYASGFGADPKVTAAASSGNVLITALLEANLSPGFGITLSYTGDGATLSGATLDGPGWTASAHGKAEGSGPYLLTNSGGALPAGSPAAGTELYVHVISTGVIALAAGREALRKGNFIQTTSAGTGTHNLTRGVTSQAMFDTVKRGVKPRTLDAATDIDGV